MVKRVVVLPGGATFYKTVDENEVSGYVQNNTILMLLK